MVLELTIYALVIVSAVLCVLISRSFGKGALSVTFYYFIVSFFLIGLHRVFLLAADEGFYTLENVTTHLWVHLIFYFGILAFILGARKLNRTATQPGTLEAFALKDQFILGLLTALSVGVFFVAQPLEPMLAALFVGSVVDTFGLHHFLAFILAVVAAWYVWKIKKNWGLIFSMSVTPFLVFLLLIGVQHFWETLVESWKVFSVSDTQAELVEQYILIPAFLFAVVSLYKIHSFLRGSVQ